MAPVSTLATLPKNKREWNKLGDVFRDSVFCLDLAAGREMWRRQLPSPILVDGKIEAIAATPEEIEDRDHPDLPRLRLHFNRRSLGRLRGLIDHLNALVAG